MHKAKNQVRFVYFDIGNVLLDHTSVPRIVSNKYSLDIKETQQAFSENIDALCRNDMALSDFNYTLKIRLGIKDPDFDWITINTDAIKPFLGSHELLEEISNQLPVGILSDTWVGLPKMLKDNLFIPEIDYAVEIYSSDVGSVKPEEKLMNLAEKQAKTSPENILFIDDKPGNVVGAKNRGWQAIVFDPNEPQQSVEIIRKHLKEHGVVL